MSGESVFVLLEGIEPARVEDDQVVPIGFEYVDPFLVVSREREPVPDPVNLASDQMWGTECSESLFWERHTMQCGVRKANNSLRVLPAASSLLYRFNAATESETLISREPRVTGMFRTIQRLYSISVKRIIDPTPLKPVLSSLWEQSILFYTGGTMEKVVGDYSATFVFQSAHEFLFLDSLGGEMEVIRLFLSDIDQSDVVYDVGSNIGLYSVFAANNFPSATVVAFEPLSDSIRRLHQCAYENHGEISSYEIVLSSKTGCARFPLHSDRPGEQTLGIGGHDSHFVASFTGKDVINLFELPPPDVVKIDVEGAELDVLEGFDDSLDAVRVVYCEVHKEEIHRFGSTADELEQFLLAGDFELERIQESEETYQLRASRTQ